MNKSTETPKRTEALLDAYKSEEEVKTVLDPKAINQSTLDKLPIALLVPDLIGLGKYL